MAQIDVDSTIDAVCAFASFFFGCATTLYRAKNDEERPFLDEDKSDSNVGKFEPLSFSIPNVFSPSTRRREQSVSCWSSSMSPDSTTRRSIH
jgi:hypothetical protein